MLARLAFGNIRRTLRDYAIYAITLVLGVAVFYAFNTIAVQADFLEGYVSESLQGIDRLLSGLTIGLALVMGFLMVYANGYLMRRRTRELGLYQVLGMRVGQVNLVLVLETLAVGGISLAVGLGLGALVSQLMVFVTAALFRSNVSRFHFFFSPEALLLTVGCFVVMFLVMMAFNTLVLRRVRLVDLIRGERRNEKSPVRSLPASALLFAAGIALIAVAYLRLSRHGIPGFSTVSMDEGTDEFALTTAMVTVGTMALFCGLAGVAVGILSRVRGFWWRDLHLFSVRQFAARINSAALSMAVIAMVLFCAITSVTTGMILVRTINAQMAGLAPFDASVIGIGFDDVTTQAPNLASAMRKAGIDPAGLGDWNQATLRYAINGQADATYSDADVSAYSLSTLAQETGTNLSGDLAEAADYSVPLVVSLSDCNGNRRLLGLDPVRLDDGQYLVIPCQGAEEVLNAALAQGHTFDVNGVTLSPAQATVLDAASSPIENDFSGMAMFVLAVPDDVAAGCDVYQSAVNVRYTGDHAVADARLGDSSEKAIEQATGFSVLVYTATHLVQGSQTSTGLVTYLAIYIGFVLVVACAAILAIQQLTAASDARGSYRTLGELGCPDRLMDRSLRSQTVVTFALPLVVALAHAACALDVIRRPLESAGYLNLGGMVASSWLTVAIFVLAYGGYLVFTYRTARGIVRAGLRSGRRAL